MAIDINTIKKLSPNIKALIVFVAFLLIGYFYWFTFLSADFEKKSSLSIQLSEMQAKIKEQSKIADQLKKYMDDVATLQISYKIALQKLPDQREIPSLFHSVASAGKDAGIEFVLFEPKESVPKALDTYAGPKTAALLKPSDQRDQQPAAAPADSKKSAPEPFYEEIPVAVSVLGSYQNILYFFDKVAKLPRIVNISDISIGDRKDAKGRGLVTSSFTIKTYMFIDKKTKSSEKTK
jgi:type IV pilus assembly protein PilO